jgi:hypothetical protein
MVIAMEGGLVPADPRETSRRLGAREGQQAADHNQVAWRLVLLHPLLHGDW